MEWGNNVIKSKDESLKIEAAVKLTAAFFILSFLFSSLFNTNTNYIYICTWRKFDGIIRLISQLQKYKMFKQ